MTIRIQWRIISCGIISEFISLNFLFTHKKLTSQGNPGASDSSGYLLPFNIDRDNSADHLALSHVLSDLVFCSLFTT